MRKAGLKYKLTTLLLGMLLIMASIGIVPAYAAAVITGFNVSTGGHGGTFIYGIPAYYEIKTDKQNATSIYSSMEYSTDGGSLWFPFMKGGTERGTINLPYRHDIASVYIRVSASFSPLVGSSSSSRKVYGPFQVLHPYGPTQLAYTANQDSSITLSWIDNATFEDSYTIIRRGENKEVRFSVPGNPSGRGPVTFTDKSTNKLKDTKYNYYVEPNFSSIPLPLEYPAEGSSVIAETKKSLLGYLQLQSASLEYKTKLAGNENYKVSDFVKEKAKTDSNFKIELQTVIIPGGPSDAQNDAQAEEAPDQPAALDEAVAELDSVLDDVVASTSAWARDEVKDAILQGLTTSSVLSHYQQPITRQHFAGIVVKLMESLTREKVQPIAINPFMDTDDEDVLKAYSLGVIKGIAEDRFDPHAKVSRQEISVMLHRAFHLSGQFPQNVGEEPVFNDASQISSWAKEAVGYISSAGIVKGNGKGQFNPLGSATREEAIALIKRSYAAVLPES